MSKIYKLTEVVNFIGGSQPPKSVFSDIKKDGYVRLIQIRDYKSDNYIVYINEDSTKKFCTEDDIMIGRYGPPVFQILRGISGAYNVALMKAEPKIDEVSKEYLFRFLQNPSIQNYIIGLSQRSAGQSGVNKEALEQYEILLPSLIEQQRIVSKLDLLFEKIDKSIALHQKNMDEANAFMGSVLNDVFGELEEKYGRTPITDVMKISNKTLVPNDNEEYNYVGLENIESNSGKLVDFSPTIGSEIKSNKVVFKNGMVLYGKLRPYLNKVWIANFDGVATTEILPFYPIDKNGLNMEYVKHYFLSPIYLNKVMNNCSGARMPRLTTIFIKSDEAYIPIPSISIQQKVVKYLDEISQKIEKIKQAQKTKMNSLKALKASILDQAFKGEL